MARRVLLPLLAAAITATGCSPSPVTAQLGSAKVAAPAPAAAAVAPSVTMANQPTVSVQAGAATKGGAPSVGAVATTAQTAPVLAPAATAYKGLFDHDYDPADVAKANVSATEPELAAAATKQYGTSSIDMGSGLGSWGLIGAAVGAGLLGISAGGYAIYTGVIGSHDLLYPSDKSTFAMDPAAWGAAYEPDWFYTDDHLKLTAWYVPAEVPTTKGILVLHGHTSNKDTAYKKYGTMLHHDYNLYFYDSRFHGTSEGTMTTLGYFERNDALIALQRLRDRGNTSIGIMGESMGGAVAIEAAAMDSTVKSCWSDCPFDSLYDAIEPRAVKRKYPFAPFVAVSVVETASIRAHAFLTQADPIKWVAKIAPRPLQLIHGQADDDTTPVNSDKLYDAAGEPKAIWRTANTTHADSWETFPTEYKSRLLTFFNNSL